MMPTNTGSCSFRKIAALLALVLLATLMSCGHSGHSTNSLRYTPRQDATLENALAELDALKTPPGVDAAVFTQLKASLRAALVERFNREGKITAKAPQGGVNIVNDLDYGQNGAMEWELTWTYKNVGDYNQDGIVNVADLTPIAIKFNMQATTPDVIVVNGGGGDKINVDDITPIAMHWYEETALYRIESSPTSSGIYTEVGNVNLLDGTRPDGGFRHFTLLLPEVANVWYRVVPYDSANNRGIPGEPVHFLLPDGSPVVTNVTPGGGMAGTDVTFVAEMVGEPPFTYAWDFNGAGTPATSADESPVVTLGAEGVYSNASVTATNIWGSFKYDFPISVTQPPPANLFTLTASSTDINVGDTVTITAKAEDLLCPMTALGSTLITYDVTQLEPDVMSFNIGAPGGDMYDLDGIWGMGSFADFLFPVPPQLYFQYMVGSDWVWQVHPAIPALNSVQVNLTPPSGSVPARTTGDLFSYNATALTSGTAVLFVMAEYNDAGTMVPETFYYDDTSPTGVQRYFAISPPLLININPPSYEPPVVNWVSPLITTMGSAQTFAAGVSGTPPLSLSWDFGGGASPNTFDGPFPDVVMGAGGEYNGNLHVDGPSESVDYPFIYRVLNPSYGEVENNDTIDTPNILPALPVQGFRASIGAGGYDGDTADYFSFQGNAGDNFEVTLLSDQAGAVKLDLFEGLGSLTSTEAQPPISLSYVLPGTGEYIVGVTCPTPPASPMDYRLFAHAEAPNAWTTVMIADTLEALNGFSMALINGMPGAAYAHADGSLHYAHSEDINGTGAWTVYDTDILVDSSSIFELRDVRSSPAIAFIGQNQLVYFSICETSDGSGAWSTNMVSDAFPLYSDLSFALVLMDGEMEPAIAYFDGVNDYAYYALPGSPPLYDSWTAWPIQGPVPTTTGISLRMLDNNCPAISFGSVPGFAASPLPSPSSGTLWGTGVIDPAGLASGGTSLYLNDGPDASNERPAVLWANNGELNYALNDMKEGTGTWTAREVPFTIAPPIYGRQTHTLWRWIGRPAILFESADNGIRFAFNWAEDCTGNWDYEMPVIDGALGGSSCFAIVQSRPCFAYTDANLQALYFAQRGP
jgi:hypothetical protein